MLFFGIGFARNEADRPAGDRECSWRYRVLCGILYADEHAFVFGISGQYPCSFGQAPSELCTPRNKKGPKLLVATVSRRFKFACLSVS